MTTIKTKDGTEIFFKDWGKGRPIVFHHGWPLSGDDWDTQMLFFADKGYRVIAHDRRGHGRSTKNRFSNCSVCVEESTVAEWTLAPVRLQTTMVQPYHQRNRSAVLRNV